MSQTVKISHKDFAVEIGAQQVIKVTVKWDAGDPPITAQDRYQFDRDPKVDGSGALTVTSPAGAGFPVTVSFTPDPDGGPKATASITVQGEARGMFGIKGALSGLPEQLQTKCKVNVLPKDSKPRYKNAQNFSNPAMPITSQDFTFDTAPPEAKSTLTIEVVDNSSAPVGPFCPVDVYFHNVRESPDDISGKFYLNGKSVTLRPGDAIIQAQTDNDGLVTVTVVANDKDGYISCNAVSGGNATPDAYIYLFDPNYQQSPSKINAQLTRPEYRGPQDITGYTGQTVPILITSSVIPDTESVGLFLNGRFEGQTDGSRFVNPVSVPARTQDLVTTTAPGLPPYNNVFYCVTKKGDLQYSITEQFQVTGTLDGPLKIDITEGAAPYSDKHPYLMPANFAVIRGPAGKTLDAHARGNFVFQDLGNASSVTFTIDEPGTATLSLIRLGYINPISGAAAAASDVLYLTEHKKKDELVSHPVVFGDYTALTGDAARQFQSLACNTVGIADGETECIVSIVMQSSNKDDYIVVGLDSGLKITENHLNKPIHFVKFNTLYKVDIVEGTSEFCVSTKKAGKYNITVSAASDSDAFFQQAITFKDLS